MADALIERIARCDEARRRTIVASVRDEEFEALFESWAIWARHEQLPPPWFWNIWLIVAGRGFGKTRAGAEWVNAKAEVAGTRIAVVGPTEDEARRVMVEGSSGLLACAAAAARPVWEPSRGQLSWPNGSTGHVYSGANADSLRGPEHDFAWGDEIAKWAQMEAAWSNLRLGLRRGVLPQALLTTTPRPLPLLRALLASAEVAVTRGRTADNPHLPQGFVKAMTAEYAGTRLGRQELDGELIDEAQGALWTRAMIEAVRERALPKLQRVVVGVDPPASVGGDACGIIVAALGSDGCGHVIEDASAAGLSPEGWAAAVAQAAARHGADRVIAEANNGGNMVESVLRAADAGLPVKLVNASRGKAARAEPVALLYARGLVKHLGAFPALEDELCGLIAGGGYEGPGRSPDRADACVWALTELMLGKRVAGPRVRVI